MLFFDPLADSAVSTETLLSASGKLLDSYSSPPLFKPYDRTSKEFRRRSVDATLILGGAQDVQPSDPVFIIRRAAYRGPASRGTGPIPSTIDELEERQQAVSSGNIEDEEILARAASPKATRQEIIAAQRVVSRANQRAILSAHKNQEQGIDISIPDHGTIRSTRDTADDRVRYSFVTHEGKTTDISDIVENEWATSAETPQSITPRSTSRSSRATDADSFRTAPDSLYASDGPRSASLAGTDDEDEEERRAVAALRSTDVDIDAGDSRQRLTSKASSSSLRKTGSTSGDDVLQDALGPRPVTSPLFNESLQDRLDRVLAKVKDDKAKGRASPGARPRSFQLQQQAAALALASGGQIPASSRAISPNGRRSPYTTGRDSPSIDQIIGGGGSRSSLLASGERRHGKKPSIASMSSTRSSNTDQPSTPITGGSSSLAHGSTLTPISSSGSRHSNPAPAPRRIVYREDFGLDTLVAIVDADSHPRPSSSASKPRDVGADSLFGPSPADWDVHPDVKTWYDAPTKRFDDLESVRFLAVAVSSGVAVLTSRSRLYSDSMPFSFSSHPHALFSLDDPICALPFASRYGSSSSYPLWQYTRYPALSDSPPRYTWGTVTMLHYLWLQMVFVDARRDLKLLCSVLLAWRRAKAATELRRQCAACSVDASGTVQEKQLGSKKRVSLNVVSAPEAAAVVVRV